MSRRKVRIVLTDKTPVIQKRINRALAEKINTLLAQKKGKLRDKLRAMVRQWLSVQPEMVALRTGGKGSLPSQLGLRAGTENSITNKIIDSIADTTHIDFKKVDSNFRGGGIILKCQVESFSNLLSIPEGFVQDNELVGNLHWLRWLLEEGHKPIIKGYHYEPVTGWGRSRGGIMSEGEFWRVSPQYAGTPENNFVTKALSNKQKQIQKLLVEELGT